MPDMEKQHIGYNFGREIAEIKNARHENS